MTGHFDGDRSLSYEKSRFAILGSALNPVGLLSHWCKGSSGHVGVRTTSVKDLSLTYYTHN
jgi:hypothetical protein